jgi:hypothetical protein
MDCTTNDILAKRMAGEEKIKSVIAKWTKSYIKGLSSLGFEYMSYIK